MADDYIERIDRFLKAQGIVGFRFDYLAKHRVVIIPYRGRQHRVIFPTSGSDWRGPANTVSVIRHTLGLFQERTAQVSRVRRRRRGAAGNRTRPSSFSELAPAKPDKFYGPLAILKERLKATKPVTEATATAKTAAPDRLSRIVLRTPWLGAKTRFLAT